MLVVIVRDVSIVLRVGNVQFLFFVLDSKILRI